MTKKEEMKCALRRSREMQKEREGKRSKEMPAGKVTIEQRILLFLMRYLNEDQVAFLVMSAKKIGWLCIYAWCVNNVDFKALKIIGNIVIVYYVFDYICFAYAALTSND